MSLLKYNPDHEGHSLYSLIQRCLALASRKDMTFDDFALGTLICCVDIAKLEQDIDAQMAIQVAFGHALTGKSNYEFRDVIHLLLTKVTDRECYTFLADPEDTFDQKYFNAQRLACQVLVPNNDFAALVASTLIDPKVEVA